MPAARFDLYIEKGAVLDTQIEWDTAINPVVHKNLTNYTAKAQLRQAVGDSTVIMTRQSSDGSLVLGGAAGTIDIKMTAAETAALPTLKGAGRWDLYLFDAGGIPTRLVEGLVYIKPSVTV